MDKLFILVEKTELWLNGDKLSLLPSYFVDGTGFSNALLIALAWALIGILVFYLFIGMRSVRLSNVPVWLCTLAAVGALTWLTTTKIVVGSYDGQTGFFQTADQIKTEKLKKALTDEERDEIKSKYTHTIEEMRKPACGTVLALNGTSVALALLVFFGASLGVKRMSTHASAVPF